MSSVKKFLSDTMIYGLSTIISRMIGFVMTPIFIANFSYTKYGIFTNLFSYASMINAVLAFGMETTYFRFLQKVEKEDKQKVFNNSFFVTLITAIIFFATALLFSGNIAAWFTVEKPAEYEDYVAYVKLFALILTADALTVVPFAKLRASGRPLLYAGLKFINVLLFVGFNLFFIYLLPQWSVSSSFWSSFAGDWFIFGWIGNVFMANMLASVLTVLLLLPQILQFRPVFDKVIIRNMLYYSFPIMIANISFIINENLDKMMIPKLLPVEQGDSDVGVYGAVAKIAIFLSLIVTGFRLGAEPFFFSYAKKENARTVYAQIMEYFTIIMVICMVGLTVNIDWLKYFIKGKDAIQQQGYWSGLPIIPFLLFNYVLLAIYMNLSIWYKLSDQTRFGLYISGIGAIITIVLNFLLIPHYSYLGAVAATTVVYLVMITLSFFWGQKHYPIPYKSGKIIIYLLIGLGLSLISFFVFDRNFWIGNLMLIVFLAAVALTEKRNLLAFFKK